MEDKKEKILDDGMADGFAPRIITEDDDIEPGEVEEDGLPSNFADILGQAMKNAGPDSNTKND